MSNRRKFTEQEQRNMSFVILPKFLFNDEFCDMSNDAKMLYAILRDRCSLSKKNRWIDKNGDIYLIYTREKLSIIMNCSVNTVRKGIEQLKEYNLIEEVRRGLTKPNWIYVLTTDTQDRQEIEEEIESDNTEDYDSYVKF